MKREKAHKGVSILRAALLLMAFASTSLASTMVIEPSPIPAQQAKLTAYIGFGNYGFFPNTSFVFLGLVGFTMNEGYGYPASLSVPYKVVSSSGSGAYFAFGTPTDYPNFRPQPVKEHKVLVYGNSYSDDATIVVYPPRTNELQAALNDVDIDDIQLKAGVYYQNAVINRDLTIRGAGIGRTIVSGGLLGSVFKILPGRTVHLEDMTIIDGLAPSGGGIYNDGTLYVTRCEIRNCRAYQYLTGEGGGIFNRGGAMVTISDSIIRNNIAARNGGGISSSGLNASGLPTPPGDQAVSNLMAAIFADLSDLTPPSDLSDTNALEEFSDQVSSNTVKRLPEIGSIQDFFPSFFTDPFDNVAQWRAVVSPVCIISNTAIAHNRAGNASAVAGYQTAQGATYRLPRAVCFGGGIHTDIGLLSIENSSITENEVVSDLATFGGGISAMFSALKIGHTTINSNKAESTTLLSSGGAVFNFASYTRITDAQMISNRAAGIAITSGGAMKNTAASFTEITRTRIANNSSGGGGGIANDNYGILQLDDSVLHGNSISGIIAAYGGGLANDDGGQAVLTGTTISGNSAKGKAKGGGLYNHCVQKKAGGLVPIVAGTLTLRNCTVSGNSVDGQGSFGIPLEALGAGIYNGSSGKGIANTFVSSCTIIDNVASNGLVRLGGGIYSTALSDVKLSASNNSFGIALVQLGNTLLADNEPADLDNNVFTPSSLISLGYNMDSDGWGPIICVLSESFLDDDAQFRTASNPFLGALQNNGGPTPTHALLPGSQAIDVGAPSGYFSDDVSPTDDQRGLSRSLGGRRDIGAFEETAPIANNDTYSTLEDLPLVVSAAAGVLMNDFASGLQAVQLSSPASGSLSFNTDGSFTYSPALDFTGTNSFTYQVQDAGGATSTAATVTLVIRPRLDWLDMSPATNSVAERYAKIVLTFDEEVPFDALYNNVQVVGSISGPHDFNVDLIGATSQIDPVDFTSGEEVSVTILGGMTGVSGSPIYPVMTKRYFIFPDRPPTPGSAETFNVAEEGFLNVALPSTLLSNDVEPEGQPFSCLTREFVPMSYLDAYRMSTNDPTLVLGYSGVWPDGSYGVSLPVAAHHGTLHLNANGTFTYAPSNNFSSTDFFYYVLSDGSLNSSSVRVEIAVSPVNDAPVAKADAYPYGNLSISAGAGVLANDKDVDGDVLKSLLASQAVYGVVALSTNGAFTYTPGGGNPGGDIFYYRLSDGTVTTAPVRVKIGNSAPVPGVDVYDGPLGVVFAITNPAQGVLANDYDRENDAPLKSTLYSGPAFGSVTMSTNGTFTYTPNGVYSGTVSFTYRANDGSAFSVPGLVKIGNTPPIGVVDPDYFVFINQTLTVSAVQGVLTNDIDPDGDPLTAQLISTTTNGALAFNTNGTFTYAPGLGFIGTDSFIYRAIDPVTNSADTLVTIGVYNILRITQVSPAPNSGVAASNEAILVAFNAAIDAASLTNRIRVHGVFSGYHTFSASVNSNVVAIQPTGVFSPGERVDVSIHSGIRSVTYDLLGSNYAWQFTARATRGGAFFTQVTPNTNALGPKTVSLGDLNADGKVDAFIVNDAAPPQVFFNNGNRTFSNRVESLGQTWTNTLSPSGATADFNGDGFLDVIAVRGIGSGNVVGLNDGAGTFTPAPMPDAPDAVRYLVPGDFDGDGDMDVAAVGFVTAWLWQNNGAAQFTVVSAIGVFSLAVSDYAVAINAADVDRDGDLDLYLSGYSRDLLLLNDGTGLFALGEAPPADFQKLAAKMADVDGDGDTDLLIGPYLSRPGTVWFNDGAGRFARSVYEFAGGATIALAVGDLDGDTDFDTLHRGINATISRNDGSGRFTSTGQDLGNTNDIGVALADLDNDGDLDAFSIRGFYGLPYTCEAWYNQTTPRARDDLYPANGMSPVVVDAISGVLSNDVAGDGGPFKAVLAANPANGTLSLSTNGSFTYTPGGSFAGTDVFLYRAVDSALTSETARVKIGNTAPVAVADTNYVAINDVQLRVDLPGVLANDTDAEGDPLSAVLESGPTNGTLLLRADGSFLYSAVSNYVGIDSFTYRATDGFATSGVAMARFDVRARLSLVTMTPRPLSPRGPAADDIVLQFNHSLNAASVNTNTWVRGGFTGPRGISRTVTGDTLRLDLSNNFFAGEQVTVHLTDGLEGSGGERQATPSVLQYQTEAPFGLGIFSDSSQRLGSNALSSVCLGDFDGDGDLDAAQGPSTTVLPGPIFVTGSAAVVIWKNTGSGVFTNSGQHLGDSPAGNLNTIDLDSDGDLDLVADEYIWVNNGAGVFTNGPVLGSGAVFSIVGDLNGDARPDIVVYSNAGLVVKFNLGGNVFSNNAASVAQLNLASLALGKLILSDLNGDAALDIFGIQSVGSGQMKVWLNDGRGIFRDSGQVFGHIGAACALGDLDNDGDLDVFAPRASDIFDPQSFVYLNRGDAFFTATEQAYSTNEVRAAALGDADGDGDLDGFVLQNGTSISTNSSTVMFNDGNGVFTLGTQFIGDSTVNPTNGSPVTRNRSIALGDLNGDGAIDAFICVDRTGSPWPCHVWMNQAVLAPVEGGLQLTISDTETAMPFTNIVVRGPTNVSLTVSLDDIAKGSFTTSSLAAGGFTGPVGNDYTRTSSTPASAQASLRQLVFRPVANRVPVDSNEVARLTILATSGPVTRTNDLATVESTSINDAPVAIADSGPGFTGSASASFVTASVLTNDIDVDPGTILSIIDVNTLELNGTLTNLGGGVFQFTPSPEYLALPGGGVATNIFTYTVSDEHNALASATVSLNLIGTNDPPHASNDVVTVRKNAGLTILTGLMLANDTDPDTGDETGLSISAVATNSTLGLVLIDPVGGVAYDPAGAFSNLADGAIVTTTFGYVLRDVGGATSTAQVTVRVLGTDETPVTAPDLVSVGEDSAPTNLTAVLLSNDVDPDAGQTPLLFIAGVDTEGTLGLVTYSNGMVTYATDGQFDYLPAGQTTNDYFSYSIRTPTVGMVDSVPVPLSLLRRETFVNVSVSVSQQGLLNLAYDGQSIFTNYPLPDYQPLTGARFGFGARTSGFYDSHEVDDVDLSLNGSAPLNVLYDFNAGAPTGSLLLGSALVTNGFVKLTAAASNQTGTLMLPDVSASNVVDSFTASFKVRMSSGSTPPADGMSFVWVNNFTNSAFGENGAGYGLIVSFDTHDGGNGEAPAIDVRWQSPAATGLVTVTIVGTNDVPQPMDDSLAVDEGSGTADLTILLLANDTDPDAGETATLVVSGIAGSPQFGSLLFTNGVVTYAPQPQPCLRRSESVSDTFSYTVHDVQGASNQAVATVYIVGTNTASAIALTPDVSYDFDASTPAGVSLFGSAFRDATNGVIVLTTASNSQAGALVVSDLDPGQFDAGFAASFRVRLDEESATPAHGFSFNWATDLPNAAAPNAEEGSGTGMSVCFDIFDDGGGEAPAIDIKWGGILLAHKPIPVSNLLADGDFVEVFIRMNPDGTVDVVYDCREIFARQNVAGFTPLKGARFSLAARTGTGFIRQSVDDLSIETYRQPELDIFDFARTNALRRITVSADDTASTPSVPALYLFQRSTNLVHWIDIGRVILAPGATQTIVDTNDVVNPAFYRIAR